MTSGISPQTHHLLRKRLLEPKTHKLLFRLYSHKTRQNRRDLQKTSGRQANTILRILFCIAVGHIPITKKNFDKLAKSKRRLLFRKLRFHIHPMLDSSLEKRKKFLYQLASLYPALFSPLFEEEHA